jgi:hypothetical protein
MVSVRCKKARRILRQIRHQNRSAKESRWVDVKWSEKRLHLDEGLQVVGS